MKLAVEAINGSGQRVTEVVEAPSSNEAIDQLRRAGLYVTDVKPASADMAHADAGAGRGPLKGAKLLRFLLATTRQLQVLLNSGTAVVDALSAVERQLQDPTERAIITDLRERVEGGNSLAEAMRGHPAIFDATCISVVEAGEASGAMAAMLERLSDMIRKQLHTRRSIVGALLYPLMLSTVSVGVLVLMLVFVVPRFAGMFESLDTALPPTTQFMLAVSDLLRGYWWAITPIVLLAFGGLVFAAMKPAGRQWLGSVMLDTPKIGGIARDMISARVIRLLGLLLECGVPMIEALNLVRGSAGHQRFKALIDDAINTVTQGEPLSTAFDRCGLVNPSICEAIRSGESSGQIGPLLLNVSDFLDEENQVTVKSLNSILEPAILVMLGLIVGFVAISLFIPLFDLTAAGGG
jgi:type II secretory pathway component PulF